MLAARGALLVGMLAVGIMGCDPQAACEEDIRAQELEERIELEVGGAPVSAELADEDHERERGWKHRRCGLEALALVPEVPGEALPVWGCGLTEPIDVAFVANGEVVEVERGLATCDEPCGGCPQVGEGIGVDLVLEFPEGALELEVGQTVIVRSLP